MSNSSVLTAGVARIDITPPIGQRMQGIVRRVEPSEGVESPLLATALVISDGATKVAVLDCDIVGFDVAQSDELRRKIGAAIGMPASHVLVGGTHTHTGPITFVVKSGLGISRRNDGFDDNVPAVEAYLKNLHEQLIGLTVTADRGRVPVRVGCGCGHADVGICREEHLDTGKTILGRNPAGPHDHRVEVLRVDRLDGTVLAILTGYAAHPVVMGWNAKVLSPDYPGVTRRVVEQVVGGTCVFLTGAAGNQATVEFLQDDWVEMRRMGTAIGCAAAQAAAAIDTRPHRVTREFDASLSSLAIYRKAFDTPEPACPVLKAAGRRVSIPYSKMPTAVELRAKITDAGVQVEKLRAQGAPKGRIFATLATGYWAQEELAKIEAGKREQALSFDIAGFRLGDFAVLGMPGEPFVEIGLAVKQRSRARQTLFAGYSTGVMAYWPDPATVRDGTAMSVTSAVMSHGISAPPGEETHQIICDAFDKLLTELGI